MPHTLVPSDRVEGAPVRGRNGEKLGTIERLMLDKLTGTVTPSDLMFERHYAGEALVDPARYALLIHGLVERPTVFTMDDLKRLPSVARTVFLECSGNGRGAFRTPRREMTPQAVDGLTGSGEWTGVLLSTLLREVGVRRGASWLRAEGGDAARLSRSGL